MNGIIAVIIGASITGGATVIAAFITSRRRREGEPPRGDVTRKPCSGRVTSPRGKVVAPAAERSSSSGR
ncbi:hypothetical protein [Streptomyces sp. NBC_00151]|uniref:hypothetical protein n=1 Tax=Streptomyces sp. NBC_00151 TaxID=2975669 RepID=UPI002DDAB3F9|nr:hypothetical protein [Streptomyces sp. NBC_00151]WRZ44941.1 hypothetical protein OG915_47520 [Streptomyces sp. NBC_00151]